MKRALFKLLFFLIPLIVISQQKDAEYYNKYAVDSLWEKDNRLYIEYMTKAIELDSVNEKYFHNRYLGLRYEGDIILALKDLDKAIEIDSLYPSRIDSLYPNKIEDLKFLNPVYYFDDKAELLKRLDNRSYEALDVLNKAFELEYKYYPDGAFFIYDRKYDILLDLEKYEELIELVKLMAENFDLLEELDINDEDEWLKYHIELFNKQISFIEKNIGTNVYARGGRFYPYTFLTEFDSIKYPFDIGLEFNLKSILNFKIDSNTFSTDMSAAAYTNYPYEYIANTVNFDDYELTSSDTIEIANLEDYVKVLSSDKKLEFGYDLYVHETAKYQYSKLDNGNIEFDHVWDLSDFPFDKQKLKVKFLVELDSSIVRLHKYQDLGIENHFDEVTGLPLGQSVEKVNFYTEYYNSGVSVQFSPDNKREMIYPIGVYEIVVSRSGSFLFIKLFVGTFLAYIMSLFAFTIRKRNFGSRIDVSVGALFIAIGNKFFAESETPMVQILTKADVINNISLLLIIMNVIFIIGQHRTDINLGKFEDSYFTLKFSAVMISLLVFITVIS